MAKKKGSLEKSPRRRFTAQLQQEQKSLGQVRECLDGWLVNRFSEDLGEDMFVQVYDDGQSTGLSFLMQVKSVTSLQKATLKRQAVVSYPFEVSDLEHWEDQSPPVVLVVWDVQSRTGVWLDVPAAIERLDSRSPGWRSKDEVCVHIPRKNGTDDAGRAALRHRIAHLTLPHFAKNREFTLTPTFCFPPDPEGQAAHKALAEAINFGETATVPGKYITGFKASRWWERAMGPMPLPESITFSPAKSRTALKMRLLASGPSRSEVLAIELRQVKAGLRRLVMTNEHENMPYSLRLVAETPGKGDWIPEATFSSIFPGRRVTPTLALCRFLLALHDDARLLLFFDDDQPIGEVEGGHAAFPDLPDRDNLMAWERLLVKLSFIQSALAKYGQFDFDAGWNSDDFKEADRLYSIAKAGFWEGLLDFTFRMAPTWQELPTVDSDHPDVVVKLRNGNISAFGLTIPINELHMEFQEPDKVLAAFAKAKADGVNDVVVPSTRVVFRVLSWGEPSPRGARKPTRKPAGKKRSWSAKSRSKK